MPTVPSNTNLKEFPEPRGNQAFWRSLYYFNLYRLVLGVAFVTIGVTGGEFASLGDRSPMLFLTTSIAFIVMAIVSLITITRGWPSFRIQACFQFGMDVILITLLGSASGGISSGLHLLLLVSVAAGGVVLPGRTSLFFAAMGTILALIEHSASILTYPIVRGTYTQVGILGFALFSTSLVINFVAARLKKAEAVAQRSVSDLAKLSKLNELVVARLDTGILVVDQQANVQLSNARAQSLLGFDDAPTLKQVNQLLHERFANWRKGNDQGQVIKLTKHGPNIALRFVPVSDQADANVVIFLEDLSHTEQHAHQLKLAALGRLTSAVAHEIRNPLGAISHAGQLINESKDLTPADRRLVDIVNQQSDRINLIIKSILRLGRPHMSEPILMDLDDWLGKFRTNFVQTHGCGADKLALSPTKLEVYMDPDHLHQVLTNLCENAIRHGGAKNGNRGTTQVLMSGGRTDKDGKPFLDVANDGPEIPPELEDKIFEPFFTTDGNGTGLGLYLARELCQDNNAQLDYIRTTEGNRFRIQFNRVSNVAA
ncbi:MAG: ATP-binding protein [Arenicellales bacterium]|nr:ATP-binding protein [Arenicellales bacterium]